MGDNKTELWLDKWPCTQTSVLTWLLLGSSLDAPAARLIARLAGLALLSLGVACWLASRGEKSSAAVGLMAAMLLYNIGAVALLAYAGIGLGLSGIGLWPAVLVHIVLAVVCIASVKSRATSVLIK
jgi:hypothetical protein